MKKNMRGWTCRAVLCRRITPGYLVFRSLPGHSRISLRESVAKGRGFNSSPHGTVRRHDRQAYACDPQIYGAKSVISSELLELLRDRFLNIFAGHSTHRLFRTFLACECQARTEGVGRSCGNLLDSRSPLMSYGLG